MLVAKGNVTAAPGGSSLAQDVLVCYMLVFVREGNGGYPKA